MPVYRQVNYPFSIRANGAKWEEGELNKDVVNTYLPNSKNIIMRLTVKKLIVFSNARTSMLTKWIWATFWIF